MQYRGVPAVLSVLLAGGVLAAGSPPRTIARGAHSQVQKTERAVARTQDEWAALWKRHAGVSPQAAEVPKVDWSKETVLAVFMGERSTGGYAVQIVGARELEGKLVAEVEYVLPKPGGFVTQAFTSPFHIAAVGKSALPVAWKQVEPKGDKR
jgi:hypothetical protein